MAVLPGYPQEATFEDIQMMLHQMRTTICKIGIEEFLGTGFFCKIPIPFLNNMLRVLITNNHIVNRELLFQEDAQISIQTKEDYKILDLNDRIKYTSEEFNITIIEIKDDDQINNFLELDETLNKDIIMNSDINTRFIDETIYTLQYSNDRLSVSFGILKNIFEDRKYRFSHRCCTKLGSSGSPVLNINNSKVIGVHSEGNKNKTYNVGIFLNEPIKEFIKLNFYNEFLLKEFNKKYNLNIKDTKINKLDLRWKKLGNAGFEDLCKIEFKELKELILNNNNITDLRPLGKVKFEKLEILDLSQNKISDINPFENSHLGELKQLYIGYNNISDIKVFDKNILNKLETLHLNDNKIDKVKNASIISKLKSKIGNIEI